MSAETSQHKEILAGMLARWGLTVFFLVCMFFDYEINPDSHMSVSHIATGLLVPFVILVAFAHGPFVRRQLWGTSRDRLMFQIFGGYLLLQVVLSHGNQFFFGQVLKLVLIIVGVVCFRILDPRGVNLRHWAWFLPTLLAILISVGLVHDWATHQFGKERFFVGPYEYEYISEFSCLMFPLLLFSLQNARSNIRFLGLLTVGVTILTGLVLTGSRGPLIGTMIAFLSYAYITRKDFGKKLVMGLLFVGLVYMFVTIANPSSNVSNGEFFATNRLSIFEDPTLSGRLVQWGFVLQEMLDRPMWMIFGAGFGRIVEWVPSDGGFYRPAITNALLAAWVPLGIVGFLGYLYLYRYLWRRLSLTRHLPYHAMGMSLLLAYIFTDQFETHWQGTRMLWYVSFVFYLFTLPRPHLAAAKMKVRRSTLRPGFLARHISLPQSSEQKG